MLEYLRGKDLALVHVRSRAKQMGTLAPSKQLLITGLIVVNYSGTDL
jgi:hypothetical protein